MTNRNFISHHGKRLVRVEARPDPTMWRDDEVLSLPEAAHLFFPDGPLTEKSLRTAAIQKRLAIVRIVGKIFTTPDAMREMLTPTVGPATPSPAKTPPAPLPADAQVGKTVRPTADPPPRTTKDRLLAALDRNQSRR